MGICNVSNDNLPSLWIHLNSKQKSLTQVFYIYEWIQLQLHVPPIPVFALTRFFHPSPCGRRTQDADQMIRRKQMFISCTLVLSISGDLLSASLKPRDHEVLLSSHIKYQPYPLIRRPPRGTTPAVDPYLLDPNDFIREARRSVCPFTPPPSSPSSSTPILRYHPRHCLHHISVLMNWWKNKVSRIMCVWVCVWKKDGVVEWVGD